MQHLLAEKRTLRAVKRVSRADHAVVQDDPEAVLAALFSQLHRRDTVLIQGANPLAQTAMDAWFAPTGAPTLHSVQASAEECAAVAAGMAMRVHDKAALSGDTSAAHRVFPVVIALLRGFSPLVSALQLMQQHELALLFVVDDELESRTESQRRLQSTSVPVLPVDRADAVAVCRVVQECLLRARNGWGGAVIHAAPLSEPRQSLPLLQQHLKKRGLLEAANLTRAVPG